MVSSTASSDTVAGTVAVLSDFMRFLVRLPQSHGLSLAELGVLKALTCNEALRISDLSADQEMTQPGMTQLVTRMERAGLVARQPDPSDGRVVLVAATELGRRLFQERDASRVEIFTGLYEHLDDEEQGRLSAALPVLTRLMQIKEAEADAPSR
jgi:DNA-binding MarR family transcriptional regulator